jgi:hypothetical protein
LAGCLALIDVGRAILGVADDRTHAGAAAEDTGVPLRSDATSPADALRQPPPDLSRRPPALDFERPPTPDLRVRPDPPDVGDAGPPPRENDCHDTVDDDLDLLADCAYPDCADEPCDDGEPCTFDDRCDPGPDTCHGTTLTCESAPCMLRGCTGGPACAETPVEVDSPCLDDGGPCTTDRCDGEVCQLRCCGGQCVDVFTDDANCGGCGRACDGRVCVADFVDGTPRISCRFQKRVLVTRIGVEAPSRGADDTPGTGGKWVSAGRHETGDGSGYQDTLPGPRPGRDSVFTSPSSVVVPGTRFLRARPFEDGATRSEVGQRTFR